MANVISVLNEHVRKVARREVRAETLRTKENGTNYRHDVAALKQLVRSLIARIDHLEQGGGQIRKSVSGSINSNDGDTSENARFRKDGLKSHRARLGISARDYGRLVGVTGLTIYNWEAGKSRPRARQLAGIIAVRKLGKREVQKRLQEVNSE